MQLACPLFLELKCFGIYATKSKKFKSGMGNQDGNHYAWGRPVVLPTLLCFVVVVVVVLMYTMDRVSCATA